MAIALEDMRSRLLTVDHARTVLARTEPTRPVPFTVGDGIRFQGSTGWQHGIKAKDGTEPVGIYARVGGHEFALTRDTVQEVGLAVGLTRAYTLDCPAELLVPQFNYWLREGLLNLPRKKKDYQFLVSGDTATAFTKQNVLPFSNLALLEQAVAGISERFGDGEILVDYKLAHSLRQTSVRLVVPAATRTLTGTGTPDDTWSLGIQFRNSLTGATPTSLEGYLFRWVCTNGMIDATAKSGLFTRRKDATEADSYAWARASVDEVLGGLEASLDAVQQLTKMGIEGSLTETLRDVFEHYRIPIQHRSKIIKLLEEYDGEITMYVVMNAITQVANESGLEASAVDSLLRVGGDLPYTAHQRCGACHRLTPH